MDENNKVPEEKEEARLRVCPRLSAESKKEEERRCPFEKALIEYLKGDATTR